MAKNGEPLFHQHEVTNIAAPQIIRNGEHADTAILFHGSVANEVMAAYETLKDRSRAPLVVSVPTLQPFDVPAIAGILSGFKNVVSVEEHYSNCGLGGMLARLKAETCADWQLTSMGIPYGYIHDVRKTAGLRASLGIATEYIVRSVEAVSGFAS
nr:transketolase C-terminal domain-containing protein [Geoanaerobacter pelophilus]